MPPEFLIAIVILDFERPLGVVAEDKNWFASYSDHSQNKPGVGDVR